MSHGHTTAWNKAKIQRYCSRSVFNRSDAAIAHVVLYFLGRKRYSKSSTVLLFFCTNSSYSALWWWIDLTPYQDTAELRAVRVCSIAYWVTRDLPATMWKFVFCICPVMKYKKVSALFVKVYVCVSLSLDPLSWSIPCLLPRQPCMCCSVPWAEVSCLPHLRPASNPAPGFTFMSEPPLDFPADWQCFLSRPRACCKSWLFSGSVACVR